MQNYIPLREFLPWINGIPSTWLNFFFTQIIKFYSQNERKMTMNRTFKQFFRFWCTHTKMIAYKRQNKYSIFLVSVHNIKITSIFERVWIMNIIIVFFIYFIYLFIYLFITAKNSLNYRRKECQHESESQMLLN